MFRPDKGFRRRPAAPFIALFVLSAAALMSAVVMWLWNAILPSVLHVGTLTFWQAAGLLVLCRLLFGGFPGRNGGFRRHGPMHDRWKNMTDDERQQFKHAWRNRRCDAGFEKNDKKDMEA